jgi:hypothetical protein
VYSPSEPNWLGLLRQPNTSWPGENSVASSPVTTTRPLSASLNPADYKVPEMGLVARKLVIGTPASPGMDPGEAGVPITSLRATSPISGTL